MEKREREIEIRNARSEDLVRICEIYSDAFSHTEAPEIHWWKILEDHNITYRVVTIDKKVVGVASLITINKLIRSGNRMGLIEDVAVAKEARGHGVGKMLIEDLLDLSVEKKCYKTILNCSDENIKFYEKCGMYRAENQMRWDRPKKN
jgi:glucosamine-phosphate N-acetyltransferase